MKKTFLKNLVIAGVISLIGATLVYARVLIGETAKSAFTFRPAALTSTSQGTAVDRLNYQSVLAVLDVGAVTGTSPTMDCKLQSSATSGGTYADIAGATFTQVTASNARQDKSVDLSPVNRFIRGLCAIGGTTPSFTASLIFILGEPGTRGTLP